MRFGLEEVQPDQTLTNADRIIEEYNDLMAVVGMLIKDGYLKHPEDTARMQIEAKIIKVEKFLKYSESVGTLKNESASS